MSETNVQSVDQNALADLFPDMSAGTASRDIKPSFGGAPDGGADIFAPKPAEAVIPEKKEGEENPEQEKDKEEVDILGTGVVEPPKVTGTPLTDLSTYYQDRIKTGKFIAVEDTDEKGNVIPFVPKTAEEYDEVLELQINYRLDEAKKELETRWYQSKSPAWKAISQYAELVDDPTQLIPFLQGVKTLTSVANLDENVIEGAEEIVRARLAQKGDTEEIITQQIDALKTTDKLISTAKLYKPIIVQQEQAALHTQMRAEQEQQKQYQQLVSEIRESALKSIETPVFGKTKLKQEEKAAIYDLIAEPAEETQGYAIYNLLDKLFDTRDFEKLKEVALLLSNRDAFMGYLGTSVANQTAASLERKLRLAGESRQSSGNDFHEENRQPSVARNQYKTKPSFGR